MRVPILIATMLASALGLAGCASPSDSNDSVPNGGGPAVEVHEGDATVEMVDAAYAPKELRIHAGSTVTFRNAEDMGHTVTPDDSAQWGTTGSGNSPDQWMNKGDTWSWTFTTPGTYDYHCLPHATKSGNGYLGMAGTIIVV